MGGGQHGETGYLGGGCSQWIFHQNMLSGPDTGFYSSRVIGVLATNRHTVGLGIGEYLRKAPVPHPWSARDAPPQRRIRMCLESRYTSS